ncbi:hypothetical protein BDY19DRAFT_996877 [Irpex rosettiformis]|uniref:Uncharacterized protein n=1 Tax=Irpex rosettiformis TaxID=378272 RepID=A0ACB8TU31_9APHY|nr:hypothetical protein BDY19DRAFT_996877 [Irpex rosettiformis]
MPRTNQYSSRWGGPPPSTLLPLGWLTAIDVLVSAVCLTGAPNSLVVFTITASASATSSIGSSTPSATDPMFPDRFSGGVVGEI